MGHRGPSTIHCSCWVGGLLHRLGLEGHVLRALRRSHASDRSMFGPSVAAIAPRTLLAAWPRTSMSRDSLPLNANQGRAANSGEGGFLPVLLVSTVGKRMLAAFDRALLVFF